ncbi:hypothetical protein ABPG72_016562 [Tetrahymena utriculariae]
MKQQHSRKQIMVKTNRCQEKLNKKCNWQNAIGNRRDRQISSIEFEKPQMKKAHNLYKLGKSQNNSRLLIPVTMLKTKFLLSLSAPKIWEFTRSGTDANFEKKITKNTNQDVSKQLTEIEKLRKHLTQMKINKNSQAANNSKSVNLSFISGQTKQHNQTSKFALPWQPTNKEKQTNEEYDDKMDEEDSKSVQSAIF